MNSTNYRDPYWRLPVKPAKMERGVLAMRNGEEVEVGISFDRHSFEEPFVSILWKQRRVQSGKLMGALKGLANLVDSIEFLDPREPLTPSDAKSILNWIATLEEEENAAS